MTFLGQIFRPARPEEVLYVVGGEHVVPVTTFIVHPLLNMRVIEKLLRCIASLVHPSATSVGLTINKHVL